MYEQYVYVCICMCKHVMVNVRKYCNTSAGTNKYTKTSTGSLHISTYVCVYI